MSVNRVRERLAKLEKAELISDLHLKLKALNFVLGRLNSNEYKEVRILSSNSIWTKFPSVELNNQLVILLRDKIMKDIVETQEKIESQL